jgi:hypothetical protein
MISRQMEVSNGGIVAKNILTTISSGKEHIYTSISGVVRKFLQHCPQQSRN